MGAQVQWYRRPFGCVTIGRIDGENRFRVLENTDGFVLIDRGERVAHFATIQALRQCADLRANAERPVVYRSGGRTE